MEARAAIAAGIAAGNINLAVPAHQLGATLALSDVSAATGAQHVEQLLRLEAARLARGAAAPVDPEDVKLALRQRGQPITLFGEGPSERRERLKRLLGELQLEALVRERGAAAIAAAVQAGRPALTAPSAFLDAAPDSLAAVAAENRPAELFYTPGSEALVRARRAIAAYSFERAGRRLRLEAAVAADAAACAAEDAQALRLVRAVRRLRPDVSQAADERPLACCALGGGGGLVATGSWSAAVKVWRSDSSAAQVATLRGHTERVVAVAWRPSVGDGMSVLASASADGTARVWRLPAALLGNAGTGHNDAGDCDMTDDNGGPGTCAVGAAVAVAPLRDALAVGLREHVTLRGHAARLSAVAFHPSGRFVGTTSFDRTWRLWDLEAGGAVAGARGGGEGGGEGSGGGALELLMQEGHAREVYPIAFHPDGSLVATGDLSGLGRVWDLRSGKAVFVLRGHTGQLLSLDWSPNGVHVASGADDHACRVWELRQQRTLYTLPAHAGLVSRVRFAPASGEFLATASFDGSARLWSGRDFGLLAALKGHDGKVVGLDVGVGEGEGAGGGGGGGECVVVTCGSDRTFKVWRPE